MTPAEAIAAITAQTVRTQSIQYPLSKASVAYKLSIEAVQHPGAKIQTCYTSGSGKHTKNQDHHQAICNVLTKAGIAFTQGNDSPRRGKTGQFIIVTA